LAEIQKNGNACILDHGCAQKEKIVAELPENPGTEGSPEPQAGASTPPPFQPVAAPYQPVSAPSPGTVMPPQPAAAPAKSGGSSALKIVLIILGILAFFFLLVVAGLMYGCYKVKKAFHTDSKTGETTITMPGGAITANSNMKFTSSELGTEVYPGAEPAKSGNMRMSVAGNTVVSAAFQTSDSKDQVVAFYKDKLGSDATSMDFGANSILSLKKGEHEVVQVTVSQEANEHDGKTQIHISHTTSSK
jgi:hypothetical protein